MRELLEFKALLEELVYISANPKNRAKRKEVAIVIISTFTEDISHYMTRNPDYATLQKIFNQLHSNEEVPSTKTLRTLLTGRTIQCAIQVSELVPMSEEGLKFKTDTMGLAFRTL